MVTTPDGVLYTAQIPLRMDGSIETGDIAAQAKLTFNNLKEWRDALSSAATLRPLSEWGLGLVPILPPIGREALGEKLA